VDADKQRLQFFLRAYEEAEKTAIFSLELNAEKRLFLSEMSV